MMSLFMIFLGEEKNNFFILSSSFIFSAQYKTETTSNICEKKAELLEISKTFEELRNYMGFLSYQAQNEWSKNHKKMVEWGYEITCTKSGSEEKTTKMSKKDRHSSRISKHDSGSLTPVQDSPNPQANGQNGDGDGPAPVNASPADIGKALHSFVYNGIFEEQIV